MTSRRAILGLAAATLVPHLARAQATIEAMRFSSLSPGGPLPPSLQPFAFESRPRRTEYALVEDEGRTVLRARADASTSGIMRELRVDPRTHPMLVWRWKVTRLLVKSDLATRDGDDFPARLYVTFDLEPSALPTGERLQIEVARMLYGPRLPVAALCYVWDANAPAETFAPNAYTDRVRMVVVESGAVNVGRWVRYERNVADDFRRAFGIEPPAISAVIVSTDTDNTGERAESYYGDVEFRPRRPS